MLQTFIEETSNICYEFMDSRRFQHSYAVCWQYAIKKQKFFYMNFFFCSDESTSKVFRIIFETLYYIYIYIYI